jgi:hypothetical protein
MTKVRRINLSQIEGDGANNTTTDEIRPYGELAVYVGDNNKLELLMFDGVRTHVKSKVLNKGTFFGGDADSSDGLNLDTIKLVPDEELRRNGSDQYLVIEPTTGEPGHIHIRAGGTIDSSTADLFIGGELNHVRVSDTNNHVKITTDFGVDGQTRTWTFDNNGKIQLPGSSNGVIGEDEPGLVIYSDSNFGILTNANGLDSHFWFFDDDGVLRLPGTTAIEDTASIGAFGTIITVPLNAAGDTEDYVGGASVLEVPTDAETDLVQAGWIITFSNDDQRTVNNVVQGGGYTSIYYNDANPGLGSSTYPLTIQSADYVAASNGNVSISLNDSNNNTKSFVFGADGTLVLPSNLAIAPIGNYVPINGTIMLQASSEQLALLTSDVGGGMQLGWSENAFGTGNLAIATFNEGNLGEIKIATGGFGIGLTAYEWIFGNDGGLTIPGDIKSENDINIEINLTDSTLRRWQFGEDGNLTLPAGGDIMNSNGVSVLPPQGEYIYDFDGINTDLTITNLNFNLLFCQPALGYLGSDTHNVNLPNGTPGQRLVIVNISTYCTLTVNNGLQITALSSPAEFIYTSFDGWKAMYGTV